MTVLDTIGAIATPLGTGGIGVIRLSGPQALDICQRLLAVPVSLTPRLMHFCRIVHPISKTPLDEGCVVFFAGPASYTGEDTVEFHLHGNPILLKAVLDALLEAGARLASPGEFTKRAFLHGKLDLTKAETVADIIHAKNSVEYGVAVGHLKGKLYTHIRQLRSKLMSILEQMEGSIDFPEEVDAIPRSELILGILTICKELQAILDVQDFGKTVHNGVQVLIVGKPNVGKSSFLNAIVGEERAIVSSIAGTTRDFIDVQIELGGVKFEFIDTAGIREATDKIEHLGIKKINTLLKKADLILWIVDQSKPFDTEDEAIYKKLKAKKRVWMLKNKQDKAARLHLPFKLKTSWSVHHLSLKQPHSIVPLKQQLHHTFAESLSDIDLDLLCNSRQIDCIKKTLNNLNHLHENAVLGFEDAMLVIDIKAAVLALGELTGEAVTEEVLDGVFSRFCVGK
jgi:tRNA modification GTPase